MTGNEYQAKIFQSTPSVGRATLGTSTAFGFAFGFQSTPSVGRATNVMGGCIKFGGFQSTPSVGRATALAGKRFIGRFISIHALRGEGDDIVRWIIASSSPFQSTPSVGRATAWVARLSLLTKFQSTPSVGRATTSFATFLLTLLFQSTPSVGRATK